ncbi:Stf0 family sulfotransferase [Microlunatus speluncae]|uniref:Stf0 family sulfotransferase n=1 Tax=Microlunatus speluncae TaxID=2594267 RepID=UPI0012668869|nr:Stf0 family sulfotransferase [Microlunatus speluncae]
MQPISSTTTELELDAYLLCATPRSGSTLLCGLLESSGVAGHPASYFDPRILDRNAAEWQIARSPDGRIDDAYLRHARIAGSTTNGVFGSRIMGATLPVLTGDLVAAAPDRAGTDLDRLTEHLGRIRLVHLRRRDVVAQAVSWARSEQTHFWHPGEEIAPGAQEAHYDEELIDQLVRKIESFEARWSDWFTAQRVTPCEVAYEDLAADPVGVAGAVLDYLGLQVPPDRTMEVRARRQADQLNEDWIERFKAGRTG